MARDHCFACGRDVRAANYCPNCGADLSPANRRHWRVMHDHERAAHTAVRKVEMDRALYPEPLPPKGEMIDVTARALAREDVESTFPAVGSTATDGLQPERVARLAREYWDRR